MVGVDGLPGAYGRGGSLQSAIPKVNVAEPSFNVVRCVILRRRYRDFVAGTNPFFSTIDGGFACHRGSV
jgi:hypothetical protein